MSINLSEVGVSITRLSATDWRAQFGIYLPGIAPNGGYSLLVRVIHEADQFTPSIPPVTIPVAYVGGPNGLWQVTTPLTSDPSSHYGTPGRHLYRYQLLRNGEPVVFWFADPFARESGPGTYSAFTLSQSPAPFAWHDAAFKVPSVDEMVVYELHVGEFARDFSGVRGRLDYLRGLGVNVIELMPFTNVKESAEWGYTPLGFYCPDDRYGTPDELRTLVDECHKRGIAVILDAVYAHAHREFAYNLVYEATSVGNPMMGEFAGEFFPGHPGTDFNKEFTRQFFLELNKYWLTEFHLDGFRYDYVPGMYDGPTGNGYSALVYATYQFSKSGFPRFQDGSGASRIIQCAEHLPDPTGILRNTYSNCCWQNQLMDKSADTAVWRYIDANFAFLFDPEFVGYPSTYSNASTGDVFPVAPFQYLEQHDNPRLITRIAKSTLTDLLGVAYGDRRQCYRLQPYVIALYTGKGIPMLWQGQEFCENWGMVDWGIGRNMFERPVHWEFFYDRYGQALVRLYRILGGLRNANPALGARSTFYYFNDPGHQSQRVVVWRRSSSSPGKTFMVFINFSEFTQEVWAPFPTAGLWTEQIDQSPSDAVNVGTAGEWKRVSVPSYYGRIYAL